MTSYDLNQIDDLLKKRLSESESKILSEVGKFMEDEILSVLDSHTKVLDSHTKVLDSHTKVLDSHTKGLKQIIVNTEYNNENIQKSVKRLTEVESHLGIVPPPELL